MAKTTFFARLVSLSLTLLPGFLGSAQTPSSAPPASQSHSVQLFGTTTDIENSPGDKGASAVPSVASAEKTDRSEFAVAPIPIVNPSVGNGAAGVVMYNTPFGPAGTKSPASTLAVAGFGTDNGTWGFMLGGRLYLDDDRYRITAAVFAGRFNYNFFGIGPEAGEAGISIPLTQKSKAFLIEPKMRFWRRWYAGPRYHFISNDAALNSDKYNPDDLPVPLPSDLKFQTAALGLRVLRDTSDNPFYPTGGSLIDLTLDFFEPAFGANSSYRNFTLSGNKYISVGAKNVIAVHGSLCAVTDEAPFFDLCLFGMSKDIRGYQIGQFRDDRMLVGQAEFRRELFWRLGAAAFAGAGSVGGEFSDMGSPEPGGGVGLRFLLAKKNHINFRADFAWGNGTHASYISVGEAF